MKKQILLILVIALAVLTGCGKKENAGLTSSGGTPTKEEAVSLLRNLQSALNAQDYDSAVTMFQVPPGAGPDEMKKRCPRLIRNNEISGPGIETLAGNGKWGKLAEVFDPDRAKQIAGKFGVNVDECYGLKFREAEAGFFWDGKQFKLIRCDDIGKLAPTAVGEYKAGSDSVPTRI